jgi:hypothetical protein
MKSAKFLNNEYEIQFYELGFIHIRSFINEGELNQLRNLFYKIYNYSDVLQGMWNSLFHIDSDSSKSTSNQILNILNSKLEATFVDYYSPVASFMVKNPNKFGITELHRDYSIQDESMFQYRNIWIPLVDTNEQNGALYAMKRSHSYFDYPLPMFCKWPYNKFKDDLFQYCDIIDAKAGDLVVYADRTLHGSFINQTSSPRPVVHFGLLHPDTNLCYHYLDESKNEVSTYDVPFSFFFENKFGNQDGKYPLNSRFNYAPPEFTLNDIIKKIA